VTDTVPHPRLGSKNDISSQHMLKVVPADGNILREGALCRSSRKCGKTMNSVNGQCIR
jgi:hypothetical protein